MPNTLVHLSIQTAGSKAVLREADFKWIAVGCILPDIPWILQRIVSAVDTGLDQYDLMNYVSAQSSLLACLLLSGALALLVRESAGVFLLLAGNSLLHLLLDAVQIKWANGVYLWAPFSWQLTSFNLFWPEHVLFSVLSLAGLLVLLYFGFRDAHRPVLLTRSRARFFCAFLLLLIYLVAPLFFLEAQVAADSHFNATLRKIPARPGRYVELDRNRYRAADRTVLLRNGERVTLEGRLPDQDAIVSIRVLSEIPI